LCGMGAMWPVVVFSGSVRGVEERGKAGGWCEGPFKTQSIKLSKT
jgi:hypothetical protein